MWKRLMVLATLALGVAGGARAADSLFCTGTIDEVLIDTGGGLFVYTSWRGDWIQLCNIETPWNSISAKICSAWLSEVITAHTTRKPTVIRYENAPYNCDATMPHYSEAPKPYYVRLAK